MSVLKDTRIHDALMIITEKDVTTAEVIFAVTRLYELAYLDGRTEQAQRSVKAIDDIMNKAHA